MIEDLEELEQSAEEELKRVDHLIFVTLKYTRTADVIKNTIKRLISAFDFATLELLKFAKKKRKIKQISKLETVRAENLKEVYPETKDFIDFYFLLKRIDKARSDVREEYRKHMTLIVHLTPEENLEIDMEKLKNNPKKTTAVMKCFNFFILSNNVMHPYAVII